jgi:hypothetical protein
MLSAWEHHQNRTGGQPAVIGPGNRNNQTANSRRARPLSGCVRQRSVNGLQQGRDHGVTALPSHPGPGPQPQRTPRAARLTPSPAGRWSARSWLSRGRSERAVRSPRAPARWLLRTWGQSGPKPVVRASQRDEAARSRWKDERWPAGKKGQRRRTHPRLRRRVRLRWAARRRGAQALPNACLAGPVAPRASLRDRSDPGAGTTRLATARAQRSRGGSRTLESAPAPGVWDWGGRIGRSGPAK